MKTKKERSIAYTVVMTPTLAAKIDGIEGDSFSDKARRLILKGLEIA